MSHGRRCDEGLQQELGELGLRLTCFEVNKFGRALFYVEPVAQGGKDRGRLKGSGLAGEARNWDFG